MSDPTMEELEAIAPILRGCGDPLFIDPKIPEYILDFLRWGLQGQEQDGESFVDCLKRVMAGVAK